MDDERTESILRTVRDAVNEYNRGVRDRDFLLDEDSAEFGARLIIRALLKLTDPPPK